MTEISSLPRIASVAALGEWLAVLPRARARRHAPRARARSHRRLTPIVAFAEDNQLETLTGLKRLRAARALGWPTVAITIAEFAMASRPRCVEVHHHGGMAELELGWLVRSLYRDDQLSRPEIARRLDRQQPGVPAAGPGLKARRSIERCGSGH